MCCQGSQVGRQSKPRELFLELVGKLQCPARLAEPKDQQDLADIVDWIERLGIAGSLDAIETFLIVVDKQSRQAERVRPAHAGSSRC